MEENRVLKTVLKADKVGTKGGWSLAQKDNVQFCYDCKSPLFYVRTEHGIAYEDYDIPIHGYIFKKGALNLRVIGIRLYCAECGCGNEGYTSFQYEKDNIVFSWDDDDLEYYEQEYIERAISIFNKEGKVPNNLVCGYGIKEIAEKINAWAEKHPELFKKKDRKKEGRKKKNVPKVR